MTRYARKTVIIGRPKVEAALARKTWIPREDLRLKTAVAGSYTDNLIYLESNDGQIASVAADYTSAAVFQSESEFEIQLDWIAKNRGRNEDDDF